MILAAGQGRRLHPLTRDKPKCLVKLFGKPILEHQLGVFRACGVSTIQIVTGHCSAQVSRLGYECILNSAYADSNMVTSLFCAIPFMDTDEDLIISYGDIVFEQKNLMELIESEHQISVMVDVNWKKLWGQRMENPLDDAESLVVDSSGFLSELGKKCNDYSKIEGQYTGLIKVRGGKPRELLNFYQSLDKQIAYDGVDFDNMYMTSFLQCLIDAGWLIKPVFVHGGWLEIDTVADIHSYERLAATGYLEEFFKVNSQSINQHEVGL